ncbi:hypothetical protein V6R21_24420 [Limibacter armeniacum]|uniref:hypothetical protein n=1 Tax=Limibacter armeniacum TaxID=466084 RepID=UPI002FE51593
MKRICIYPKDIQLLTGKSERTARRILSDIRKEYGKEPKQLVTITEFCLYTGLKEQQVLPLLH